jgi:hypothetical protein
MAGIKPVALWSPPDEAAAVVTSDSADIPGIPANGADLYVGVAGDVKVDMNLGGTVTFKAAPVGRMNIRVRRVYATGTAATFIVALW